MHVRARLLIRLLTISLATFASVTAGGCAGTGSSGLDAAARLERLAETAPPNRQARSAPAPPGLSVESLAPVAQGDPLARLSVAEALAGIDRPELLEAGAADAPSPTPSSILHYISGRSRLLAGDLQGALAELEVAAKADPTAAEPWREIGETQRRLGDRLSAAAAYRQALRLNPDDLESLLQVGLWSLQRRDAETGAALLARARSLAADTSDSALTYVIDFNLGRALLELGALRAGVDLLTSGLNLPETLDSPTAYRAELESIFRRRGDAWREVGDAAMRLEDFNAALRAYENAAALPTLDPAGLLPRHAYAAMRSGRPARAAIAILDALATGTDLAGDRVLPLVRYVGANSDIGPLLRDAIDQRRDALSAEDRPRLESLYARAAAAALPAPDASAALRERLVSHPSDSGAVRDLFRLVDHDPARMLDETVRLIAQSPMNEHRYAEALLGHAESIESLIERLDPTSSHAAAILSARLLHRAGDAERAVAVLSDELNSAEETRPRVASAMLVEFLADLGRIDAAAAVLERLTVPTSPSERLLAARALAAVGRLDDALEAILPAIESDASGRAPLAGDPNELDAVVLAAELYWRLGDAPAVERWARRAIDIDPSFEAAYARLIDLYKRGGPLADGDKLSAIVRQLRDADPSSRTLRWLRAQELVANGQYDQAERDLLSLAEEDPTEPIVNLLTTLWLRTGSAERAETWLRSQIESHPNEPALTLALARLLGADGRAEDAVALLEEWLAHRPYDDEAARQLEIILREELNRVRDADQRALKRLESQPPTLARAVELSDILVRLGQADRAAEDLLNEARTASGIPPSLVRPFLSALLLLGQEAIQEDVAVEPVVDLFELAAERFPQLPVEVYEQHMNVLAKADAPYDAITRVLDRAMAQHRNRAKDLSSVALVRFLSFNKPDLAVRVADHLYGQLMEVEPRFFQLWLIAASQELDADSAIRALRATATHSAASDVMKLLSLQPNGGPNRMNAELTMNIGDGFAAAEAPFDDVVRIYELGVDFDPNHETLNNNYGYYLAVQGERLDDAESLVRRSLTVRSDDPFATDSLGWVLYRKGVLYDEIGPDGEVLREGAVTVLERAAAMAVNRSSAEVQDHFGDALWATGQHNRAQGRWNAAEAILEEQIEAIRIELNRLQAARDNRVIRAENQLAALEEELTAVRAKLEAIQRGGDPPIAEILGPINHPAGADTP